MILKISIKFTIQQITHPLVKIIKQIIVNKLTLIQTITLIKIMLIKVIITVITITMMIK
jgi:hypothetical protein